MTRSYNVHEQSKSCWKISILTFLFTKVTSDKHFEAEKLVGS